MAEGGVDGKIKLGTEIVPDSKSVVEFEKVLSDLFDKQEKNETTQAKRRFTNAQKMVDAISQQGETILKSFAQQSSAMHSTIPALQAYVQQFDKAGILSQDMARVQESIVKTAEKRAFAAKVEADYAEMLGRHYEQIRIQREQEKAEAEAIAEQERERIAAEREAEELEAKQLAEERARLEERANKFPQIIEGVLERRVKFLAELSRLKDMVEEGINTSNFESASKRFSALSQDLGDARKAWNDLYETAVQADAQLGTNLYKSQEFSMLTAALDEVETDYHDIEKAMKDLDKVSIVDNLDTTKAKYAELQAKLQEYTEIAKTGTMDLGGQFKQLSDDEMRWVLDRIDEIKEAMSGITQPSEPLSALPAKETIEPLTNAISKLGNVASKVGSGIKTIFTKAFNAIKSLGSKVFNNIKGRITGTLKSAEGSMKRFTKKMLMVGLGVRGIMMAVRRLRTMVLTSFKDLANGASEFAEKLNAFTTAWTQVKGSIATAFQPIASVVLPILTQLCNRLSAASVELAKFFATLTGQKYVYQFTAANNNLNKSVKGTGKATKEANKSLAQYDKLMVIPSKNDAGGGSGGGAGDDSKGVYQKLDIGDGVSEFALKVKKAWENSDFTEVGQIIGQKLRSALMSIQWGDIQQTAANIGRDIATFINGAMTPETFAVIGNTLGQLLNTAVSAATGFINSFYWGTFGQGLANGLNNFFNSFDTGKLGTSIGNLVNGIFNLIGNFASKVDTDVIGTSIATGISNAINTIDAQAMGNSVNKLLNAIFNLITTTASQLPWDKMGSDLAKFLSSVLTPETFANAVTAFTKVLNGIITSGLNFVQTYDWKTLGTALGTGINTFIQQTNWADAGATLGGFIQGLIQTIHNTITTTNWTAIGQAITTYINSFLSQINLKELGQSASGLAIGLLQTISTAIAGIDWSTIGSQIVGFIASIDWITLLANVVKTAASLVKGIKSFVAGLIDGISDAIEHIGEGDFDMEDFVKTIFSAISTALEGSGKLWTSLIKLATTIIKTILKGIITVFGKIINGEIKWEDIGKPFVDIGQWIVEGFTDGMSCDWWQWLKDNLFNPIYNGFKSLFGISSPSTVFQTLGNFLMQGLQNGISAAIAGVVTIFTTLWTNIKSVFDFETVKQHFLTVFNSIKTAFNGLQTWFATTFGGAWAKVKEKFNLTNILTHFQNVVVKIKSAFTAIKEWFSSTFGGAWSAIKEKFALSNIRTHFNSVLSTIKTIFSNIADWFKTKFTQAWTNVKNVFSTGGKVFTGIKEGIATTFKSVVNKLIDGINTAISKPFTTISSMVGKIRDAQILGAKPFYNILKNFSLSAPKIPKLAQGAVIPPNKEFLAVLGDQKKGTNIETPLETMVQAFKMALGEAGGNHEPINLNLDGKIVAQVVWDEEEKKYKQTNNFRFA